MLKPVRFFISIQQMTVCCLSKKTEACSKVFNRKNPKFFVDYAAFREVRCPVIIRIDEPGIGVAYSKNGGRKPWSNGHCCICGENTSAVFCCFCCFSLFPFVYLWAFVSGAALVQ
ncbi:hypothetical protein [uncultured Agathobaculum sp.]|uniref:hypothetical protein n=1 Tax=uncultured Agathobaculum sp. TaxID=2048140 RepID=UPI00320A1F44